MALNDHRKSIQIPAHPLDIAFLEKRERREKNNSICEELMTVTYRT